jgi:hypothetical protein
MKTRTSWSEELIHSELIKICGAIGSFPSNSELQSMGRGDLSNQIAKKGGFLFWSKRMGFDRKDSDSDFGWSGEQAAADILDGLGYKIIKPIGVRSPYDLIIDGCLRIDVKTANFADYGACRGWFYRMGKHIQSDVVMLYQADTQDCYYIPWFVCPTTNITISKSGGIYAIYKNNEALLRKMVNLRRAEMTKTPKPA